MARPKKNNESKPVTGGFETNLWAAADQLWANSGLKPSEYSVPVLGLIFLKYAYFRFEKVVAEVNIPYDPSSRIKPSKEKYQSKTGLYIPDTARFSHLKNLPEGTDIGKSLNEAMKQIERENVKLERLNGEARVLEERIAGNYREILSLAGNTALIQGGD